MGRLGAPVSDDTILRHLKRGVADRNATTPVRVAGIDDWSWRKGRTYGAIVVDLERREVVDVLPDRSAAALDFSRPGKPTDNAFIEAFNGRLRAECLNTHWFLTLADAREKLEDWRKYYNEDRPHGESATSPRLP